jgi:4-amino-4-deoxy-L-arabinose transferase-like glycosyltransferase
MTSQRPVYFIAAVLLLLVFLAQVLLASPANSAAFDEEYHFATGYAYLRTGDPRLSTEHPPLVNVWNALPLLFLDPKLPLDQPAWQNAATDDFGDMFLWQTNFDRAVPIVLISRLPIAMLGLLLGAIVFRWASSLFGMRAGLLALTLFAFDPNLIAQSRLSTTDLGLALMMTLAMWRMWAWLRKPTWLNLVLIGVASGAAITTKFTGVMLAPLFLLAGLLYPTAPNQRYLKALLIRVGQLIVAGLIALLCIWIVYGFEIKDGLPAATYWHGLIKIFTEYSQGYPTYLLGQISRTGWWYYFPVTFVLKTPLPTLILLVVGFIVIFTRREARCTAAAWLPPLFLMGFALISPLAIGYRHILPVLPFVIVVAGGAAQVLLPDRQAQYRVVRGACGVGLVAWLVMGTLTIYPHHLSYFNEIAGGPAQADRVLVDSNLDWGQDLPALKQVLQDRNLTCINLSYFGTALPAAYGVRYSPLPGFLHFLYGADVNAYNPYTPEPGWYAISNTSRRLGTVWSNPDLYTYFRDQTPIDHAGYSISLYEVKYPPETPVTRAVIIGTPTFYVPTATLGLAPNTRVNVKWVDNPDSIVLVDGPARYITDNPLPFDKSLRKEFKAAAQQSDGVWIVDAQPIVARHIAEWQAPKPQLPDGASADWPLRFNDQIDLIGFKADPLTTTAGSEIDLTTYWRVSGDIDTCAPLAMFVHVANDQAGIAGQYDGWNTALRGLEVGDVIVQHVRIPIKPDATAGTYNLQIGLYATDSGQRWIAKTPAGQTTDRVILAPIEISGTPQ